MLIVLPCLAFGKNKEYNMNDTCKTNIYFSLGKQSTWYRFFRDYDGLASVTAGIGYDLNQKLNVFSDIHFGWMHNEIVNGNAYDNSLSIGVNYTFFEKNKMYGTTSIGTGFEYIHMRSLHEECDFQESLIGIPVFAKLIGGYNVNDKISLYVDIKSWYSFMYNDGDFAPTGYYYKTWFMTTELGVSIAL